MPDIIERPLAPPLAPLWVRLAWFVAIASGSALAVAAVAEALRFLILH
jgi:hypothetical protein